MKIIRLLTNKKLINMILILFDLTKKIKKKKKKIKLIFNFYFFFYILDIYKKKKKKLCTSREMFVCAEGSRVDCHSNYHHG